MVQNNGATSNLKKADVIIAQVDGLEATKQDLGGVGDPGIAPGGGGLIIKDFDCGSTCTSGIHSIRIGTRTGVVESSAYCK